MEYDELAKFISPRVISQMETLAKAVSPTSAVYKAIQYSMPKQTELDRITNAFSKLTQKNAFTTEINRLQKAFESITIDQVANKLAFSSIAAVTAFDDRISSLLKFAQSVPDIYRIFNNSLFCENTISIAAQKLRDSFDVISRLQSLKFDFPSILVNQHEGFKTVPYITNRQKVAILEIEHEQNNNLLLSTDDIDNADCIDTTIQTSIALVDQISHNPEPMLILDTGNFNHEYDLKEALCQIKPSFYKKLLGAKQSANSNNVEKTRHISVSLRELLKEIINTIVPTDEVKNNYSNKLIGNRGNPSLEIKIDYFFKDITSSSLAEFVKDDIKLIKKITGILSTGVHSEVEFPSDKSLFYLIDKVESIIYLLLKYNIHRKPNQEPPHA